MDRDSALLPAPPPDAPRPFEVHGPGRRSKAGQFTRPPYESATFKSNNEKRENFFEVHESRGRSQAGYFIFPKSPALRAGQSRVDNFSNE